MIRINLLRPQHFGIPEGEKKIIEAMLRNSYNSGLIAGESRAYRKVIDLLKTQETQFLSIFDRRRALPEDPTPDGEGRNL